MRASFVSTLGDLAEEDQRVMLITGDLGFKVVEGFAERFPDRFVNVGVAEANLLGIAAGLSRAGMIPYCYSIATFASMRGYEQLRNGAVVHGLPVRLVGIGGGFAYGTAGITHWALEDLAITRVQPGLTVVAPADDAQTATALRAVHTTPGPAYFRVGKDPVRLAELAGRFRLGHLEIIHEGSDAALVATGSMGGSALEAASRLAPILDLTVAVAASIAPAPTADLHELIRNHPLVATVEDHYVVGGLGSMVAEVIADAGSPCTLLRCGVDPILDGHSGSETYLRARAGLAPHQLASRIVSALAAWRAA